MKRYFPWLLPILAWLAILPFTPEIDLAVESYFYKDGQFSDTWAEQFMFHYGIIPAHIVAWTGGIVFLLSFICSRLRKYRALGLYLALVLAIGSGLISNVILKDLWNQPRPKQIVAFGGTQEYRTVWQPILNPPEPSRAFPCGHCTMGFYFFAVAIAAYHYKRKKLFWASLAFALFLGSLLGWIRMAQGGHFFSDVISGALIMWLTAYWLRFILDRFRFQALDQNPQGS